jgi:exopolysaccharide biosynthesis polyprenyl glycosylphosphotransferase
LKISDSITFLRSRHSLGWILRIFDLFTIIIIYYLIFGLRINEFPSDLHKSYRFYVVLCSLMGALYLGDCYNLDRHQPQWILPLRTIISTIFSGLFVGLSIYLFGPELLNGGYNVLGRTILIPSLVIFSLTAVFFRIIARKAVDRLAGELRWLVIARRDGDGLDHFWRSFQRQRSPGEFVVLADGNGENECPIMGSWSDLDKNLKHRWSGMVIIAGWSMPDEIIEKIMNARLRGLRIYDVGDFYERMWEKLPVHHLHNGWFAVTSGFALLHERNVLRYKRLCDILFSLSMLIIFSPIMVITYIVIRLENSGPGFFSQPRVGINGNAFTCWKFRTMKVNSEQGGKYTEVNDNRITRVGRILRKMRLDEFPQLWNVLRGDMSFIGPRAEWTKCVEDYEHVIPFYQLRHLVKPGLTGWAQVNYPYGASVDDAREKLEYDLYYLKNHSFSLDMAIILRTIKVVLFGTGAR